MLVLSMRGAGLLRMTESVILHIGRHEMGHGPKPGAECVPDEVGSFRRSKRVSSAASNDEGSWGEALLSTILLHTDEGCLLAGMIAFPPKPSMPANVVGTENGIDVIRMVPAFVRAETAHVASAFGERRMESGMAHRWRRREARKAHSRYW